MYLWIPDRDGKRATSAFARGGARRCDCLTLLRRTEGLVGYRGTVSVRMLVAKLHEEQLIDTRWPEKREDGGLERPWTSAWLSWSRQGVMERWGREKDRDSVVSAIICSTFWLCWLYRTDPFKIQLPSLWCPINKAVALTTGTTGKQCSFSLSIFFLSGQCISSTWSYRTDHYSNTIHVMKRTTVKVCFADVSLKARSSTDVLYFHKNQGTQRDPLKTLSKTPRYPDSSSLEWVRITKQRIFTHADDRTWICTISVNSTVIFCWFSTVN